MNTFTHKISRLNFISFHLNSLKFSLQIMGLLCSACMWFSYLFFKPLLLTNADVNDLDFLFI